MAFCECGCGRETTQYRGRARRFIHGHNMCGARTNRRVGYIEEDRGHSTPCWIWQGAVSPKGYARRRDALGRKVSLHRLMWEESNGPVPGGKQLDHLCRQPSCIRPSHLEPVTPAVNTRRGRNAKLVADQVRAIRRRFTAGERQVALAAEFGIRQGSVANIVARRSWRDI